MAAWLFIEDSFFAFGVEQALHRVAPELPVIWGTPHAPVPHQVDLAIVDVALCEHMDADQTLPAARPRQRPPLVLFTADGGFRPVLPGTLYLLGKRMRVSEIEAALHTICSLHRIMETPPRRSAALPPHAPMLSVCKRSANDTLDAQRQAFRERHP